MNFGFYPMSLGVTVGDVKIETLEPVHPWRTQVCLDLFLICRELIAAGSECEILVLREQSFLCERIPEDLVVPRTHVSCEFLDHVVIGIRDPLAEFV